MGLTPVQILIGIQHKAVGVNIIAACIQHLIHDDVVRLLPLSAVRVRTRLVKRETDVEFNARRGDKLVPLAAGRFKGGDGVVVRPVDLGNQVIDKALR